MEKITSNQAIIDKLAKIYGLIERGSTEGERQAAKSQYDKIFKKYNLTEDDLIDIVRRDYEFKFANLCEQVLLKHISAYVLDKFVNEVGFYSYKHSQRKLYVKQLTKLEHLQIVSMYEYFRRHMKGEYKKIVKPAIDEIVYRHRNGIKVNVGKVRYGAQMVFISKYLNVSGIARWNPDGKKEKVMTNVDSSALNNIEAGQFNQQVSTDSRTLSYEK